MKKFKHIINTIIWTLAGLYIGIALLVNIPFVQKEIGSAVSSALSRKLGTRVWVGKVDLGLFNRLIIDDVRMLDQEGASMFKATRLSAKFDYVSLARGKVVITSAQLFGLEANLYKRTEGSKPNYQFVVDSLSSKDTTSKSSLDLSIGSLIVRHGSISYNQLYAPHRKGFDTHHLQFKDISGHLVVNKLTQDSVNVNLKKLAFSEQSGLNLKDLEFSLVANQKEARLSHFKLILPSSEVQCNNVMASYVVDNKKIQIPSLQFEGTVDESILTPSDISCFIPSLRKYSCPVVFSTHVTGTSSSVRVSKAEISIPKKGKPATLSSPSVVHLLATGSASSLNDSPRWYAQIADLSWTDEGLELFAGELPPIVERIGRLSFKGRMGGKGKNMATQGTFKTGVGDAQISAGIHGENFHGKVVTDNLNLQQLLANKDFGQLAANLELGGQLKKATYRAKGTVTLLEYGQHAYHNLKIDGSYGHRTLDGHFSIDDANIVADFEGNVSLQNALPAAKMTARVDHFEPSELLPQASKWKGRTLSGTLTADFKGKNLNTANGYLELNDFAMRTSDGDYQLSQLRLEASNDRAGHHLALASDFATLDFIGNFDYNTFVQSIENLIVKKLPSIQQLTPVRYRKIPANEFTMVADVYKSDWLQTFFNVPLELVKPIHASGDFSDKTSTVNANIVVPEVIYDGNRYRSTTIALSTVADTLKADVALSKCIDNGRNYDYHVLASAYDDQMVSAFSIDNHAPRQRLRATLHSVTRLMRNSNGKASAQVNVQPSDIYVGDTLLTVAPSVITYSNNHLAFDNFSISHGNQWLEVNGLATNESDDSLEVDLHNVNLGYILQLVNFHAVDFSGYASGKAYISQLFGRPDAHANLKISDFRFEEGEMGVLYAGVKWNPAEQQIDIDAQAHDTISGSTKPRLTTIRGFVSPKHNNIDLNIIADNTRGDFVQGFCSAFLNHVDLDVDGAVRVWGDLNDVNLTGELVVSGDMGVIPLNTVYKLHNDSIHFLYNEIFFPNDVIKDKYGNTGVIKGSVYHEHLSRFSYDLNVKAENLLAYDWDGSDGSTFYGTIFGTGNVDIKGRPGELNVDVNIRPERNSQIVYDASSPEAISSQDFIHWQSRDSINISQTRNEARQEPEDIPTDIHLNFLINTTPDAALKVVMDKTTDDYIILNGSGTLNATYYNKGGVEVFGNYVVDHGIYKLTIQNIIHREFRFSQGGTIAFGGNPMDAALQLKALYPVNSVSLADLQLGRSFTSSNIRVDCYMNITGTPRQPKVDFSLDMPTVGNDAKQMIYSLINSEEEMNQQVLYLLAVGRFYSQGSNNSVDDNGQNRTSLAMQSILSGQISQQLNNVLSNVVNNTNWNFGANISTGDEGWNNAEYEGLLSGRLLNNRLIVNGQFGYRDNANATTSFIGDFDIRYLIFPNGNFSIRVYNQTNDRYFTRSTLNTQGLGFVLKKDFNGWKDLFSRKKKSKTKTKK